MSSTNFRHPSEEDLSAFVDGMLDLPAMQSIGGHVETCPTCRAACDAFRENKGVLRSLAVTPPESAGFWARAFETLEADSTEDAGVAAPPPSFQTHRPSFRLRWQYAAAAVLVLGAVVAYGPLSSLTHVRPTVPASPVVAVAEEEDSVDLAPLVLAHTSAASQQPLADAERQAMLAVENDTLRSEADIVPEESL